MILAVAISLIALTGQIDELPEAGEDLYEITLPGGEIRYGAIRESAQQVTVVFDEPWAPKAPRNFAKGRVSYESEPKIARDSRRVEVAKAAGYILRESATGSRWLPEEEVRYFERARDMARQAAPPPAEPAPAPSAEASPAPGVASQYGPHAAVLVLGALLLAVIIKTMILSD